MNEFESATFLDDCDTVCKLWESARLRGFSSMDADELCAAWWRRFARSDAKPRFIKALDGAPKA